MNDLSIIVSIIIGGASAFVGALVGTATIAWRISSSLEQRFAAVDAKVDAVKEVLVCKMDEHDKMDIERFSKQDLAIMRIELVLQKDGVALHRI